MNYLLDTSAWLAHFRQEAGGERVQALFNDPEAEILLASLSLTEFARRMRDLGASRQEIGKTLTEYWQLFSRVIPVDEAVALSAIEIASQTQRRLPLVDAIIAAAAESQDACLVHRDEHIRAIAQDLIRQRDLDSPED
jgi:predicted nucleic acid-binding protein